MGFGEGFDAPPRVPGVGGLEQSATGSGEQTTRVIGVQSDGFGKLFAQAPVDVLPGFTAVPGAHEAPAGGGVDIVAVRGVDHDGIGITDAPIGDHAPRFP